MHEDFYASQGVKSDCIRYKTWIGMEKRIYISPAMMAKFPKCAETLMYAVKSQVSKTRLIKEEEKDKWIAHARYEKERKGKHANRYVWRVTLEERKHEVFKGLKNLWSCTRLLKNSQCALRLESVHGIGGH